MNKSSRQEAAQETLSIIQRGSYQNSVGEDISIKAETTYAVEHTQLFRTDDFPDNLSLFKTASKTEIEVTSETTLGAVARVCQEDAFAHPFVLNFASAKNPGGGFLNGAQAQEESLARSSSLFACLMAKSEMYDFNRRGSLCLYSDWMIYSPKVPVFRNDAGSLTPKSYLAAFMTSPAVNAGVIIRQEVNKVVLIESTSKQRARKVLWVANHHRHKILILGAWGYGVFQNEPRMIARIFRELLTGEFENCFERIIMAIYDNTPTRNVYQAFVEEFRA